MHTFTFNFYKTFPLFAKQNIFFFPVDAADCSAPAMTHGHQVLRRNITWRNCCL